MARWRGGACGGGVPLRPPGRPPESGLAQRGNTPRHKARKAKSPLRGAKGQVAFARVVSLPALDYAGAVSESALRRDGEGRSPMDPLRVTGSVGRGDNAPPALREVGVSPAPADRGNPARRGRMEHLPPGPGETPPLGTEETWLPAKGGISCFPRGIGGVTAPMPVGPFAPESKTGVPKIAERGAPGRFHLAAYYGIDGPALRPPPSFSSKTRAKAAGTREIVASIQPNSATRLGPPAPRPHREEPCGFAWRLERRGSQRVQKPGPARPRPSRRSPKRACSSG